MIDPNDESNICDEDADTFITLKHLAEEFGLERSNARKYILKCGVRPHKRRTADSGGQLSLTLTAGEADFIRSKRKNEGFIGGGKASVSESGYFYMIRLIPEFHPGRIKLGFADEVSSRLAQHRTAAPTATLVRSWPCKRVWEPTIIDFLAADCRLVLNEVYDCEDVESLVAKADRLFAMLPDPGRRAELSPHSPHNT